MTFQCNPVIGIIVTYAPTETTLEQEKEQFYNYLNVSVASIPQHNFVVIAGDFNARIGSTTYHDHSNTNGQHLVDSCEEQNLISTFYHQTHKKNHMWT